MIQAYQSRRSGRNRNRNGRLLHWRQRTAGRGGEAHRGSTSWSPSMSEFFVFFREVVEVADACVLWLLYPLSLH
jgi:hypothetical protein